MATIAMRGGREEADRTLLFLLLAGGLMLFTTFTASYLVRRQSPDWTPVRLPPLVWANTAILLASGVTIELARRPSAGSARTWMTATAWLGFVFTVGQAVAWFQLARQGVFASSGPHASFFYMLTGVHGLHLLAGLVALSVVLSRGARPRLAAAWWHFVDACWIWVVAMLTFL